MDCQKDIAQTIRDEKADYLLRLKDNQGNLLQDVEDWFAYADQIDFQDMQHDYHQTVNTFSDTTKARDRTIPRLW
jgi:predicted transposase YbfD/YdcC